MSTSDTTGLPERNSLTPLSSEELDRVVGGLPEGYYVTVYSKEGGGPARYTLHSPSGAVLGTFASMDAAEWAAEQDVLASQG